MAYFDWEPLKPADLVQVLAIPVTVWITYRIFKLGEVAENRRFRASLASDHSLACEELIKTIEADCIEYYTSATNTARHELGIKINLHMKGLSRRLGTLAEVCKEKPDFFSCHYLQFFTAATGGDFGSKNVKKLSYQDPRIQDIHGRATDLSQAVHRRIKALLR